MADPTRIVFLTDAGFLKPTLVAMASLLDAAKAPVEVHFTSWKLDPRDRDAARRVAGHWPQHRLEVHVLDEGWLRDAQSPKKTIPPNALGKLLLPRLIGERFLYVDGDILVRRDLSPLMRLDLGENLLAGVPDYVVSRWAAEGRQDRLDGLGRVMGEVPPGRYVNSGVLLFDSPRIVADDALMAEMADMQAARGFSTVDQDRINQIFAGRIAALDPAWNASWGRVKPHRTWIERAGVETLAKTDGGPAILHYHGPGKPWHFPTPKILGKGARSVLSYRVFLAKFRKQFPDLVP
ncbi:glycosyltransferase [Sulfitobacter sp. D35]|uniref:glycosyltransferase family 8 protein n=1 Tax=Sulfitobacter sp. D35 TaxID=3083252 RepID=UPI00296E4A62|nr:glycosyltransferase [Sulfitobacter sp. D35]MDW4498375.1 glycosyltransferase [Sulfitobacter sp. D35]